MKKFYFLFGIVTIGILLLGSTPMSIVAQDDEGPMDEGPPPGTYDILLDLFLENKWDIGPTTSTPSGKTNTNLKYTVTDMVSPLNEYFNAGFFPIGDPTLQAVSVALDGDFIDSELFVKIVNDQGTLIDWQAALMVGKNVTISWLIDETLLPPEALSIVDIFPDSLTLVEGTAPPPFPVVKSTTDFSEFFSYSDLVKDYGYDGLPFFLPGIFYLDNVSAANEFWTNEMDLSKMLPVGTDPTTGEYMTVDTVTSFESHEFNLSFSFAAGNENSGIEYGNASAMFTWDNTSGYLDYFSAEAYGDIDEDGTLEASEQFLIELQFDAAVQDDLPISVGDKGEYLMDVEISVLASGLENATDEVWVNEFLDVITSPINDELIGMPLINYSIDSMDGLYYHIDGYMFDIERYFKDRFGPIFGPGGDGEGAQDPGLQELPPLESYYHPIGGPGGDRTSGFAINLFDASVYMNNTEWYEGRSDVWPEEGNTTHLRLYDDMPGVIDAWIFDNNDWWNTWNKDQESFEENFEAMLGLEIHHGPPTMVEVPNSWYNCSWVYNPTLGYDEWICEFVYEDGTHPEWFFINNSAPWEDKPYYIVFQIQGLPETDYTSYISESNPYMMLGKMGGNDGNGDNENFTGTGAQTGGDPPDQGPPPGEGNPLMMFIRGPQDLIPMPARTPDWDIVGGLSNFAEGLSGQLNAVFTSVEFIDLLENSAMDVDDPGDMLSIDYVDFGLDWIDNGTHAGTTAFFEIVADVTDDNPKNRTDISVDLYGEVDYLWKSGGHFDTVGAYLELQLVYDFEKYPEPSNTTTEPEPSTTTTTTEDPGAELSPGFELFFTLGTIALIPILYKKKR